MTELYILVSNTVRLICFTILAIIFKKWWIVFWVIPFWTFLKSSKEETK